MKIAPFPNVSRIRNNDADHCTQFALLAALETLGDHSLDESNVDEATGYRPGGTWPYTTLSWLGEHGYRVRHFESADFQLWLSDPVAEFRRQGLNDETVAAYLEVTDIQFEQRAIRRAIDNPRVELITRRPEIEDIVSGLEDGWLPMLSLDATTLNGGVYSEFDGHIVLATAVDENRLRLQDPGPPPHWEWDVDRGTILQSLRTPSENSGTVTLIRRDLGSDQEVSPNVRNSW